MAGCPCMHHLWRLSGVLSVLSALAAVQRERVDDPSLFTSITIGTFVVGMVLIVGLNLEYRRVAKAFFGGTIRERHRRSC